VKRGKKAALEVFHIHMGGVTHNEKSERHHLPLLQSDFNYVYFLKAIKEFNVKGRIISEGPMFTPSSKNCYC
jgi:deoxyribonuclease-4